MVQAVSAGASLRGSAPGARTRKSATTRRKPCACSSSAFAVALLQRFRADVVKIDRRFVTPLPEDVWTRSIVRHMIALAHDLGMRVIGEGVETPEQAAWLLRLDCDELQGCAIAQPMPGDELVLWAAAHQTADRAVG